MTKLVGDKKLSNFEDPQNLSLKSIKLIDNYCTAEIAQGLISRDVAGDNDDYNFKSFELVVFRFKSTNIGFNNYNL